jgi:hypothetical protein
VTGVDAQPSSDDLSRRRDASDADAELLADRRRQAALRLVRDGAGPTDPAHEVSLDPPLFEATTSPIGGDVDAAGDRLAVWADRVEWRDGRDRLRGHLAVDDIDRVEVRRRLTSATLVVTGTGGEQLVLKGVRAAAAARFRDTVAGLRLPAAGGAAATPTAEALRRLDELAAMGLLTEREVAEKRSLLAQRGVTRRG